mgnify:CR=1 FL=1
MEFDYKILAKYIIGEITFEEQTSLVEWSQMSEENNLLLKKIVEARILKKFVTSVPLKIEILFLWLWI